MSRVQRAAGGGAGRTYKLGQNDCWVVQARQGRHLRGYAIAYQRFDGIVIVEDVAVDVRHQNRGIGTRDCCTLR